VRALHGALVGGDLLLADEEVAFSAWLGISDRKQAEEALRESGERRRRGSCNGTLLPAADRRG